MGPGWHGQCIPGLRRLPLLCMNNKTQLKELYAHMKWADNRIWTALDALPNAKLDESLRERMFHIHYTQHAFLDVWKGKEFKYTKSDAYPTFDAIRQLKDTYYDSLDAFVDGLDEGELVKPLVLPWVRYIERQLGIEAMDTTLGETMYQIASHSVHHRAQVNLQIREHGGDPPMIDYIVWLWLGKPKN